MPRFSSHTIAIVRRNGNEMLTDTCVLSRKAMATGNMGEPLPVLTIVATGVRCRVIRAKVPSNSSQQVVGSQQAMVDIDRLECPYDTALTVDMIATLSGGSVWQLVSIEDKLTDLVFAGAVVTQVRT